VGANNPLINSDIDLGLRIGAEPCGKTPQL
jgi:hypothetical protein